MATTIEPVRSEERIARPVHPWLRSLFFWPVLIHCALCFVPLFLFSSRTGDFFAWETGSSLTAAVLGAGYAGACTMFILTLPEKDWTSARGTVFAPITLLLSALVLTGVYADEFHFTDGPGLARVFAWLWLISLSAFPITCFVVYKVHNSGPKTADPRGPAPMRADVSIPTAIMGAVLWGLAFALWIAPETVGDAWAWQLEPLDARMLGSWFFAFGAGAWQALWEHDLHRMRAGFLTDVTLSVLSLAALAVYADDVRWGNALTWVYLVVLVGLLVAGLTGRFMALPEALEAERKAREEEPAHA